MIVSFVRVIRYRNWKSDFKVEILSPLVYAGIGFNVI